MPPREKSNLEPCSFICYHLCYYLGMAGYFYWQIVAEKLDLGADCRAWEGVDCNPTEKLLSAYGERAGSTVRNLAKALRKAGLTQFADEVEKLVSTPQDQDDDTESA